MDDIPEVAPIGAPPAAPPVDELHEARRVLDSCVSALMARARRLDEGDRTRRLLETSAEICLTTSLALAIARAWPELALVQVRAAYEATRICTGESAKADDDGAVVSSCSETRDELKRLLAALESTTGVAPLVRERDLPRVDDHGPRS